MSDILKDHKPISVQFSKIKVFPSAVVIVGVDSGQYQAIRNKYAEEVGFIEGTKLPPAIIHSTIARFNKEIDLKPVEEILTTLNININHTTNKFSLIRETRVPMLEYSVIKVYKL